MNKKKEDPQQLIPFDRDRYWRDELNFAEFPLAALHPSRNGEPLVFEDTVWDPSVNKPVPRKLTISPATSHGLPTAFDEEVLLGLIQLTSKRNFENRRVTFTRFELIRELGWKDTTQAYRRIEESLNKWIGVTLYYDNAWWNNEEKSWVSEKFHVLDNVSLLGKERREKRLKDRRDDPEAGKSVFTWNELVFKSFQAGYLRKLNFDLYNSLDSTLAKRMYRFLGKKFWHRANWNFDLRDFACEHVGLSKKTTNAKIKLQLRPAIEELVAQGFLRPMPEERRFKQIRRGEWKVFFVAGEKQVKGKRKATEKQRNRAQKTEREMIMEFVEEDGKLIAKRYPKKKAGNG